MDDYERDFYEYIYHDLGIWEQLGSSGVEIPLMTLNQKYPYSALERAEALVALKRNVEHHIAVKKSLRGIIWTANMDSSRAVRQVAIKVLERIR